MKLFCKLISFSILVLMHLSSCEEGNAAAIDSQTNIKDNKVFEINLSELTYIPIEKNKCNCLFSSDEKNFNQKQFIFVNDEIVTAYVNIDGVLTKFIMLDYKKTAPQTLVSNYQANGFKLRIEMKPINGIGRKQKKYGKITLKAYDGREVVKSFFGECIL